MASGVWKFDVAGMVGKVGNRKELEISEPMGELSNSASAVTPPRPVLVSGHLEAIEGNRIVLEARLAAQWAGECRRCAKPVTGELDTSMREIFERNSVEGETYPIEGTVADIEPAAREAAMVLLPDAPLCRDNCAGLCAVCGTDLNEGSCNCEVNLTDPRWAALDQLKDESDK